MDTIKFEKKNVKMVAHRGLCGIETENTNAAFVAAGNRTYFGIETDIHRTSDGHFAINHDKTLGRVSKNELVIEENTLRKLRSVILYDKDKTTDRKDLRVSSLEEYIGICKKYEKHCVLELKSDFTEKETEKFIKIIKKFDYLDNVTFISFKYDNLLKVRKILPNHSAQFLFSKMTDELFERLVKDKFDIDIEHIGLSKELIKKAHDNGLKVNCWTVNDKETAEKLTSWGVDYITTNILE